MSGAATATFVYDGDGNRVKGTVGGVTITYIGNYYEWSGSTATSYYYAGSLRVAMRQGSTLSYLLADQLGSTSVVANSSGSKTAEVRYKAWGEDRYTSGTVPSGYRYTGQRVEATLGLYFYGARWYDSSLGRFLSADTIVPNMGDPQAWDRYAYVNNNPVNFVDPSGRKPCIDNDKNGQCKVDLEIMRLPAYPKIEPGNGSWKLITRAGAVSWYDYPIRNDRTIKDPNDLEDQSYLRMQGSVQLNGINYNWIGSRWVQNHLPCEYASSTQCITPYEYKTSTQPVTGAVHIPGQIPQGQNLLILIQIPGAEDDFGNGVIVNTRDECPACTSIKVDILTIDPRSQNSYNLKNYDYSVYIWVWVPDSLNP